MNDQAKKPISDGTYSLLLVAPALIIIIISALYPLGYAVMLSARHVDLTSAVGIGPYVGLDNYRFALNDRFFWSATGRTVLFAIIAVSIEMILGISIAFLLNRLKWFKGIVRSLLLLPLAAAKLKLDPAVVASPALTTIVDITGLLIYFYTVKWVLGIP